MINEVYKILKERLNGIAGVKHIDWFNDQYSGIIHTEPGILIEFVGNQRTETLQGQTQQIELSVRIHVYSKVIMREDKSVDEGKIDSHFEIVKEVYRRLQGYRSKIYRQEPEDNNELIFNSMQRTGIEHHQYMRGWFVTTQDFQMMGYDIEETLTTTRPEPRFRL